MSNEAATDAEPELPLRLYVYSTLREGTLELYPMVETKRRRPVSDVGFQFMVTDDAWREPLPDGLERRGWVDLDWDRNDSYGQATFAVLQCLWPTERPPLLRGLREPVLAAPIRIDLSRLETRLVVVNLVSADAEIAEAFAYANDRWLPFARSDWRCVPGTRRYRGSRGTERPLVIGAPA